MEKLVDQYKDHIAVVLRGVDRIMIKGYIKDFYQNKNLST